MKDFIKDLIIVMLLLRDFYNQTGWRVDGIFKPIVYSLLCITVSSLVAIIETELKKLRHN